MENRHAVWSADTGWTDRAEPLKVTLQGNGRIRIKGTGDMRESISSGHFSVDQQALDAATWLELHHFDQFKELKTSFPELENLRWQLSHFDTEAMGVDPEWGSWLIDAIEATDLVRWEDGEPWIGSDHHADCEDDECEGCDIGA